MNPNSQTDLLPCPHCGSSTEPGFADSVEFYDKEDDDSDYGWFVVCNASNNHAGCGAATGFYKTKAKATKAWNKRAPSAGPADTERLLIATNAYNAAIYEAAKCADDYATNCMGNNEWKAGFDAGNDIARYIRALKNAAPQPQVGARKEGEPRLPAVAASEAGKDSDTLPFVVEYRRKPDEAFSYWKAMAAFDTDGRAQAYAKKCYSETGPWEYRVRPDATGCLHGSKP